MLNARRMIVRRRACRAMNKRKDINWAFEAAIIIVIVAAITWGSFKVLAYFVIENP